MARNDGRIEKGQRLSSAISARAWNRAQQAADIVLGTTESFSGEGYTVSHPFVERPVQLNTAASKDWEIGTAIQITGANPDINSTKTQAISLVGEIAVPVNLAEDERAAIVFPRAFAIAVAPIRQGATVARVCIAGFCYAKISNSPFPGNYVCLPTNRGDGGEEGVLERSEAGYGVFVTHATSGSNSGKLALIRL